ncbi:MAG TPA: cellulose binding domain-containing protein [Roseiflexaceae bacterium]|nr:cellulose binding domain-containing protein [Roseiflexaceae bacterium]
MARSQRQPWRLLWLLVAVLLASPLGGAQAQATACAVSYTVTNAWPGGFQADVAVSNTGTAPLR